jgi:CYTH domain-containing protein
MGVEIERRFLVLTDKLPEDFSEAYSYLIDQTYLSVDPWVRVRIYRTNTPKSVLTVKGKGTIRRPEVNCEIPLAKAQEMWPLGKFTIHKLRHEYERWEVDEFTDRHAGLWLAEIELKSEDEKFEKPDWVGEEVTEDIRYTNAYLAEFGLPDPMGAPAQNIR